MKTQIAMLDGARTILENFMQENEQALKLWEKNITDQVTLTPIKKLDNFVEETFAHCLRCKTDTKASSFWDPNIKCKKCGGKWSANDKKYYFIKQNDFEIILIIETITDGNKHYDNTDINITTKPILALFKYKNIFGNILDNITGTRFLKSFQSIMFQHVEMQKCKNAPESFNAFFEKINEAIAQKDALDKTKPKPKSKIKLFYEDSLNYFQTHLADYQAHEEIIKNLVLILLKSETLACVYKDGHTQTMEYTKAWNINARYSACPTYQITLPSGKTISATQSTKQALYRNSRSIDNYFKIHRRENNNLIFTVYQIISTFDTEKEQFNFATHAEYVIALSEHKLQQRFHESGQAFAFGALYHNAKPIQSTREILNIINNSNQKHMGLSEFIQSHIKDQGALDITLDDIDRYLYTVNKVPVAESLFKVGLFKIYENITQMSNEEMQPYAKHKSIYDVIKLKNKKLFKITKEMQLGLTDVNAVRQIMQLDPHVSINEIKRLNTLGLLHHTTRLETVFPYAKSIHKILEYLMNVEAYQCIPQSETLYLWDDYLRMADRMGYNMNNRSIAFPNSLKKEHDIVIYSYNAIKDKFKTQDFQASIDRVSKYNWNSTTHGLLIRVPNTPEEVIAEGKTLHHCVASYVNQIVSLQTNIFFIRNINDPETPYYTLELDKMNQVTQVKGLMNKTIDTKTRSFVHAWAYKHGLTIRL